MSRGHRAGKEAGPAPSTGTGREEGRETVFSVETTTDDGMHQVVRIEEVTETGVATSAGLAEAVLVQVRTTVRGHLDMLGHQCGPALTEVVMSEAGTRIRSCHVTGC